MKRFVLFFGSVFFLIFARKIMGQEVYPGVWSVAISSGGIYGASSSLHGDIGQYEASLGSGTTATQYPFSSYMAYTVGFGADIAYRFAGSPYSFFAGGYGTGFNGGSGRNARGGRFSMAILSVEGGVEYTFGQTYQQWNFYGRFGLVPSVIAGSNRISGANRFSFDSLSINSLDTRLGIEIEIGERYHIPRWPFGIEVSVNYTDVNLIGKSYTTPVFLPGAFFNRNRGANGSINDGKNPNDPNDKPRTIDYLSIRGGVRFYF